MNYIKFNNFVNYMIKIYAYKIKNQSKNRYLFETMITL